MKKLIVLFCLLATVIVNAQAPQSMNYQGVARDAVGNIINTTIGLKFEILQGSPTGSTVYAEINTSLPSSAGIFTTAIGSGVPSVGTFSTINWAAGPYYITVSIDPAGGTSFTAMGTSQLLSVPYALYAEKAGSSSSYTAGTGITINSGTITNSAPNKTVNISPSGIANILGTYPNYTVDVAVPSFTGVGSTTVTGTYPNYTITTPPASTVATLGNNIQINPPHATTTLSPGNYSINVVPTTITGPGVLGSYPNYTVTAGAPSTSITAGSANIIVNGTVPSYTISATTPTIQINTPNTITPLGLNNYSITVPANSLTGVGVASVSGVPSNYTVTVPSPSLSVTGNSITISQGTVSITKTITTSPWNYGSGILFPINNTTNDKVAIGQNVASANLDVLNSASSSNTNSAVVYINNANSGLNTSGILQVKNSVGSSAAVFVDQNSNVGDGIAINTNGATNGGNALQVQHLGLGNAGYFSITNSASSSRVIDASTNALGNVISAVNTNSSNNAPAIYGNTNGSTALYINNSNPTGLAGSFNSIGCAVYGSSSGTFHTFQSQNTNVGTGFYAGYFNGGIYTLGKTTTNSGFALKALNSLSSDLFVVRNDGNVGVGVSNPGYRLSVFDASSVNAALYSSQGTAASSANAHGVYGLTGNTHILAAGVMGENNGSGPGIFGIKNSGSGPAGRFEINSTTNTADGLFSSTAGGGAAIHAVNGPTVSGGSNASVWLESGHLKSTQLTAPIANTISVSGGGISSATISLSPGSTDVKGTLLAVITTTGIINQNNNFVVRVNFNKVYTNPPVVVMTPASDNGVLHPFVSAVSATSFTVTFKNPTTTNMSALTPFSVNYNYMVIE